MPENKTKPTDASAEDYIASRAKEQQRTDCRELMALLEIVTRQSPRIWGPSIVGYGSYRYAYLGRYELNPKRFFTATREGDRLIMDFDRGEVAELFPEAPDKFFTKGWDIQVSFGRDAKGSVTHLDIVVEGRPSRRAKKVR